MLIANVSNFLEQVNFNNAEKKSESTDEKYGELLKRSQKLISNCKSNSAKNGKLIVDEASVPVLSGTTAGIRAEADIEKRWLQLRMDIINVQSDHKKLTEETIVNLEQIIQKIN